MISIREQDYGLDVALYGEFTLADFKLFEEALMKRSGEHGKPDILLDLSELKDFTIDMALEEVKFMRAHEENFGRIALVVEDVWIKLATHIAGMLSDAKSHHFETVEEAQVWLKLGGPV